MTDPTPDVSTLIARKEALAALRLKIRRMIEERWTSRHETPAVPPPRYDEVFFAGTRWLDRQSYEDRWTD